MSTIRKKRRKMRMEGNVLMALGLTLFAGLATGVGSIIGFFTTRTNTKFLSVALGFSAGVMIYVSLVEIFVKAKDALTNALGATNGYWMTIAGFFGGVLFIALIDKFIPKASNPHEVKLVEDIDAVKPQINEEHLMKMGVFTAMNDPSVGIAIAIAVAIHNIPEGIAVSVPIYFATGSRKKAFKLSFLSGLAEPVGAIVAFFLLMPFLNDVMFGVVFAGVAGIMVFISLDELLPAAQKYDEAHLSMYGLVAGMAVMAISLVLLA